MINRILLVGDDKELKRKFVDEFDFSEAPDLLTQSENEVQLAINQVDKPLIGIYQWLNAFITSESIYKSQFIIIFWNRGWTNEKIKWVRNIIGQVVSDEYNTRVFLLDVHNRFELKLVVKEFIDIIRNTHPITPATQYIQNRIAFGDNPYVEVITML